MIVLKCRRRGGDLLAFGPDSRMLAARSETGLQVWRDFHSKPIVFRELTPVASMHFTPDGESLVFDGPKAGVIHFPTNEIRFFPKPESYRYLALAADGRSVVVADLPRDRAKFNIACWPLETAFTRKKPLWKIPLKRAFIGRPIPLSDGRFLVDEGDDGPHITTRQFRYVLRSGADGSILSESEPLDWFSERDAASSDGRWLVGQHMSKLRVWSIERLEAASRLVPGDPRSRKIYTDVAFHPSGRFFAATGTTETVKYFDPDSLDVVKTYSWDIGKTVGIAFSPDGLLAAAAGDRGRIVICDVEE